MSDHELRLGRGRGYAADPDLSPAARMAAIAQAYAATGGGGGDVPPGSPIAPPPAWDLHDLLERAALEGRQPEPSDTIERGHEPEPPTMRCQRCGWWIRPTDDGRWTHVLGPDGE